MKLVSDFSYYIDIHKKTIVTTVCFSIIVACLTVIYIYTRTPTYPDELVAIDTLCDEKPQKAETMLKRYRSTHNEMNSDDEWYCRFLQLKSDVKLLKPFQTDKEASAILDHYESEDDSHMLPQVYYYVGCVYYILGDSPQAINLFQKGLSIISDTVDTEKLQGLYYYMLGYVYTYQYLHKEALSVRLKSLEIHKKLKANERILYDYISLSWTYSALGRAKEALHCLKKAMKYVNNNDVAVLAELNSQIASTYFDLKKYNIAKHYIDLSLKNFAETNDISLIEIAAEIYSVLGYTEQAKAFYSRIITDGNIYNKKSAYLFFSNYYKNRNDLIKAYESSILYGNVTDSIVQMNASDYSAKANAAYNYKIIKEENSVLRADSFHNKVIAYIACFIIVFTVSLYIHYRYKAKKKYKDLNDILNEVKNRTDAAIEKSKKELLLIKESLKTMNEEKTLLQQKYETKEMQLKRLLQKNLLLNKISLSNESIWTDTSIYKNLKRIYFCHELVNEDTIDWIELEETLFSIYPTFKDGLSKFKPMKGQSYHVCLLIKAGFNTQQIAYFTLRSDEAINSTRRRLFESNFGKTGKPSEWDDVLRKI